jgi:hypothetical protein
MKLFDQKDLISAVPVAPFTRTEKLVHWADLIRKSKARYMVIFHDLEHWDRRLLTTCIADLIGSMRIPPFGVTRDAFSIAMADPTFQAAGLKPSSSLKDIMEFFKLSQEQLHEFSCDCGGEITKTDMAERIEHLATRK